MIRRDIDRISSWTDADLWAAYEDMLNKDAWTDRDKAYVEHVRTEMARRKGKAPHENHSPQMPLPQEHLSPSTQTRQERPKQTDFEERYRSIRQK